MFDKLEAVEKRYQDLEALLADPDVIGRRAVHCLVKVNGSSTVYS